MDFQVDKQFGARLRTIRKQKGMTQEQVSAKLQVMGLDMARGTYAKIEVGQRHIYLGELLALQRILDVPFSELLDMEWGGL